MNEMFLTHDENECRIEDNISDAESLKNAWEYAGKETAELYICVLARSISGPVKHLKRFRRVFYEPGQSLMKTYVLNIHDWSFTDRGNQANPEPG